MICSSVNRAFILSVLLLGGPYTNLEEFQGLRSTAMNAAELVAALDNAAARRADILCAWGGSGRRYGQADWFKAQAAQRNVTLFCLTRNADGSPHHPLYLPYDKDFEWFGGVELERAVRPLF